MIPERHLRIGNVSGATGDCPHAMLRMAEEGSVDIIVSCPMLKLATDVSYPNSSMRRSVIGCQR